MFMLQKKKVGSSVEFCFLGFDFTLSQRLHIFRLSTSISTDTLLGPKDCTIDFIALRTFVSDLT